MILFYSKRPVYADMFMRGLRTFLSDEVECFSSLEEELALSLDLELLIIDGLDMHPQRLKKLIGFCAPCPVILLSDGQYNGEAVTSQLGLTTSIKDVAEMSRLVLNKPAAKKRAVLTAIEELLAAGLAQGQSNKQIARTCDLPLSSVKYYLQNMYLKLEVNNRVQAALKLKETTL